jgi:predicted metalloprotease with PDZ domain
VIQLSARDAAGRALAVTKRDKSTWQVAHKGGSLDLVWQIYARDGSVRGAYLDREWAFFNGTSVFLEPLDVPVTGIEIDIAAPDPAWRLATALAPVTVDAQGFGRYAAPDYETLIDSPVLMGPLTQRSFEVAGVPHHLHVLGVDPGMDVARLAADLARICTWQAALFGALPMDRYHFLLRLAGDGYGGLEHRTSCALLAQRKTLPQTEESAVSEDYAELLGLCSHEYFHAWHVKRIRPAPLVGADLSVEAYTRQLWVFEGITSYYDDLALVRSGCIGASQYLGRLAHTLTRLRRTPGRFRQSVTEASFDAWIKLYKPDEATPNHTVSYYTKGSIIALCLDLMLRRESSNSLSLDHVMRRLWQDHGQNAAPLPEAGFEELVTALAGDAVGSQLRDWVHGREELPVAELLAHVGVEMNWGCARDARDVGGYGLPPHGGRRSDLGMRVRAITEGLRVEWIAPQGAAARAGMACGDVLVALDGLRLDAERLERLLRRDRAGRVMSVHGFREDRLMTYLVQADPAPLDTCWLRLPEGFATRHPAGTAWLGTSASVQGH